MLGLLPALAVCLMDRFLATRHVPYRPAATAAFAFVLAVPLLQYAFRGSFPGRWRLLPVALIATIPAAVCSSLSGRRRTGT